MELSFNLEKMFSTEESRFSAYKKWIAISAIFGPVSVFADKALESLIRVGERSNNIPVLLSILIGIFAIISIMSFVFSLVTLYINGYIYWKSKTLWVVMRMIIGLLIGSVLSLCTGGLSSLIILYFNRKRLIEYMKADSRFIIDQLILWVLLPLFCFVLLALGVVVSLPIPKEAIFFSVVVPLGTLVYSLKCIIEITNTNSGTIKDRNILFIFMPWLGLLILFLSVNAVLSKSSPYDLKALIVVFYILIHSNFFIFTIVLALLVYWAFVPIYTIFVFNREKAAGNTFFNTILRLNIASFVLLFCIISVTSFINNHIFNGDAILHDISSATDPSGMNADGFATATPDMDPTDFGDISNMNTGMYAHSGPDIGFAHHDSSAFTHDAGLGYASPSPSDMQFSTDAMHPDVNFDGSFSNPGSDVFGGHFADMFSGTNMADIPHIQQHPYMVFNDASIHGDFQICDPSGMPQMSVSDGNILNAEGVTIGHVHTDPVSGTTTFTDMNNTPLYSVDSHGQMFSDDCYIGHTSTSGNVTVMKGINENIIATKDAFNGVWRDIHGKIISQVKPM